MATERRGHPSLLGVADADIHRRVWRGASAFFSSARSSWRLSSAGSDTGGWQAEPEQRTANDLPDFSCGRLGMVAARAGGRFLATASFGVRRSVLLLKANAAVATT